MLKIALKEAERLRAFISGKFPTLATYKDAVQKELDSKGYLTSLFGRRRRKPISFSEMLNYVQQSSASDITVCAMIYLTRKYRLACMIHDDLSFFIPDNKDTEPSLAKIAEAMICIPWVYVCDSEKNKKYIPLSVDCSVGERWGAQNKLFTLDALDFGYKTEDVCIDRGLEIIEELKSYGW